MAILYLWTNNLPMKASKALYLSLALALADLAACSKDPLKSFPPELTTIKTNLETAFGSLDAQMSASATRLTPILDDSIRIRSELRDLFSKKPEYVLVFSLVYPPGTLEFVEPPVYYPIQGSDISDQDHIIRLFKEKVPVLSETFLAVEGFHAVVIGHPVIKNGEAAAGVTSLFNPQLLLSPIIDPLVLNQDFEIWMMENSGTLIWDQDIPDIGRNLFTDPYYDPFPNLKIALEKIVADDFGETTYSFFQAGTSIEVVKRAHWVTFSKHGQEWKIVHVVIE